MSSEPKPVPCCVCGEPLPALFGGAYVKGMEWARIYACPRCIGAKGGRAILARIRAAKGREAGEFRE